MDAKTGRSAWSTRKTVGTAREQTETCAVERNDLCQATTMELVLISRTSSMTCPKYRNRARTRTSSTSMGKSRQNTWELCMDEGQMSISCSDLPIRNPVRSSNRTASLGSTSRPVRLKSSDPAKRKSSSRWMPSGSLSSISGCCC